MADNVLAYYARKSPDVKSPTPSRAIKSGVRAPGRNPAGRRNSDGLPGDGAPLGEEPPSRSLMGRATGGRPKKMLKMKVDPEMYMKTKGRTTKCPINVGHFCSIDADFAENPGLRNAILP